MVLDELRTKDSHYALFESSHAGVGSHNGERHAKDRAQR